MGYVTPCILAGGGKFGGVLGLVSESGVYLTARVVGGTDLVLTLIDSSRVYLTADRSRGYSLGTNPDRTLTQP